MLTPIAVDILGGLTGDGGIAGKQCDKVDIFDQRDYGAVHRDAAKAALRKLTEGGLKELRGQFTYFPLSSFQSVNMA